jgi:hypothetical protein
MCISSPFTLLFFQKSGYNTRLSKHFSSFLLFIDLIQQSIINNAKKNWGTMLTSPNIVVGEVIIC